MCNCINAVICVYVVLVGEIRNRNDKLMMKCVYISE